MTKVIEGILVYDLINERYQIEYGIENYTDGLHCGETLQVYGYDDEWHDSRIEFSHETNSWYLIGFGRDFQLVGAKVRYINY